MKDQKIEIGDQVAFNRLDDATWFVVEKTDGCRLTVREVGGYLKGYVPQIINKSLVARVRKAA